MAEQISEKRLGQWFLEQSVGDIRFNDITAVNYLCGLVLSRLLYCSGEKYEVVTIDEDFYEQCVMVNKRQMKFVIQRLEGFGFISTVKNRKTKLLECKVNVPLVVQKVNELPGRQYVI
jgi:hypothetical protein